MNNSISASISSASSMLVHNTDYAGAIGGYGINSTGSDMKITGNNVSDNGDNGIFSTGTSTIISENTILGNSKTGIYLVGNNGNISNNTIGKNTVGIGISDSDSDITITGNNLSKNIRSGIEIISGADSGNGKIYNNYFGNEQNIGGTGNSSRYSWTNPDGPEPGINIVGGKYVAGNYWSNATGDGWSDQQSPNETGYSLTPYEVVSGVNDNTPLIQTITTPPVSPTSTPTEMPTITPTATPTNNLGTYFADHQSDITPDTTGVKIVITKASLPDGTIPGATTQVTLDLVNIGSIQLSPQAKIMLLPANPLAQPIGGQPTFYQDGRYHLTFSLHIPTQPGTYVYIFNPIQIIKDSETGKNIQIPAGDPVQFTATVGSKGTVTVTSP